MTLEVDTQALRAHAGDVDYIAGQLKEAIDAGATTVLADEAFGLICSFIVPVTTTVQRAGVAAIGVAAATTNGVAAGMRATASTYDAVDGATNGALTQLIAKLP